MEDLEKEIEREPHFFRTLFFILVLIVILLIVYGKFLGNKGLILKEYEIYDSKIPDSFNNLKIAHFSDILYDDDEDIEFFEEVIKKINDKKVDIIIFSGNLTKGKYKFEEKESDRIINELQKLNSTYGKYYVTGPSDKDDPSYDSIMQNSGFININDSKDIIYSKNKEQILLVGMNTPGSFLNDILKDNTIEYKIITFSESDNIDDITDYNFNLALASNSLNGQVNIPIVKDFFVRDGSKKYINPYYKVNNTDLYISSGIGTDNIDFRLFNKPSANIYILKKNKNM